MYVCVCVCAVLLLYCCAQNAIPLAVVDLVPMGRYNRRISVRSSSPLCSRTSACLIIFLSPSVSFHRLVWPIPSLPYWSWHPFLSKQSARRGDGTTTTVSGKRAVWLSPARRFSFAVPSGDSSCHSCRVV